MVRDFSIPISKAVGIVYFAAVDVTACAGPHGIARNRNDTLMNPCAIFGVDKDNDIVTPGRPHSHTVCL